MIVISESGYLILWIDLHILRIRHPRGSTVIFFGISFLGPNGTFTKQGRLLPDPRPLALSLQHLLLRILNICLLEPEDACLVTHLFVIEIRLDF